MSDVTVVGLELATSVFRSTALEPMEPWRSVRFGSCRGRRGDRRGLYPADNAVCGGGRDREARGAHPIAATRRAGGSPPFRESVRSLPLPSQRRFPIQPSSAPADGAVWLGLTPRAQNSGGNERPGSISKMGDGYIRRLLVVGATAVLRMVRQRGGGAWITALLARKKPKAADVALANKRARIACA